MTERRNTPQVFSVFVSRQPADSSGFESRLRSQVDASAELNNSKFSVVTLA
jgi:hypothetical protein